MSGIKRENIIIFSNGISIPNEELPNIYSATADEILEKIMFAENSIDCYDEDKSTIDILFNKHDFQAARIKA